MDKVDNTPESDEDDQSTSALLRSLTDAADDLEDASASTILRVEATERAVDRGEELEESPSSVLRSLAAEARQRAVEDAESASTLLRSLADHKADEEKAATLAHLSENLITWAKTNLKEDEFIGAMIISRARSSAFPHDNPSGFYAIRLFRTITMRDVRNSAFPYDLAFGFSAIRLFRTITVRDVRTSAFPHYHHPGYPHIGYSARSTCG